MSNMRDEMRAALSAAGVEPIALSRAVAAACRVAGVKAPEVEQIMSPTRLGELADEHRMRPDWHEPDEQGIGARIIGTHLDNAMGPTLQFEGEEHGEYCVVLTKNADLDGDEMMDMTDDIAVINLADLLAWAAAK